MEGRTPASSPSATGTRQQITPVNHTIGSSVAVDSTGQVRPLTRESARVHHGTDWGSLRWWPRAFTRPVLLCADCYAANRRFELFLFGLGAAGLLLVAGALALVVKLVAMLIAGLGG